MNSSMEVGKGPESLNSEGRVSKLGVLRDRLNLDDLEAREIVYKRRVFSRKIIIGHLKRDMCLIIFGPMDMY